jgi:uncharacterized protein YegP (UPF0339 family)
MPATFVLQATNEGKARVELWSAQGQRLLSSELYDSKQAARNAIATIRRAASEAEIVDSDQSAAAAKKAATGSKKAAKKSAKKSAAKKAAKKSAAKKAAKKSAAKKAAKKSG